MDPLWKCESARIKVRTISWGDVGGDNLRIWPEVDVSNASMNIRSRK